MDEIEHFRTGDNGPFGKRTGTSQVTLAERAIGDFGTEVDSGDFGILLRCSHVEPLFPHNFPTSLPLRTLYHISMYCFKCYFCLLADRGYFPDAFFDQCNWHDKTTHRKLTSL